MPSTTLGHLIDYVLPAASEYDAAEASLSEAYVTGIWASAAKKAMRKAAEAAVAIDGLRDRAQHEFQIDKKAIWKDIGLLCSPREGAPRRAYSVANAYRHSMVNRKGNVIASFEDLLTVSSGYGTEAYGVGKRGFVEVFIKDANGQLWKYLGDVPTVVAAWFRFLNHRNVVLPTETYRVCGVQVHP